MAEFNNGVPKERCGWRDEKISRRHRRWGRSCPLVDLDWLVIEYHTNKAVALIEYKHKNVKSPPNIQNSNYQALIDLADKADIPIYAVYYDPDVWSFDVFPINDKACEWLNSPAKMTEREYVRLMYQIRYTTIGADVLKNLKDDFSCPGEQIKWSGF